MYGSAHANRTATRRNELQTFSVDTTHAQGHFDLYPASYANALGASELLQLQRRGGIWLTWPASGKFDRVSRMP